MRPKPLEGTQWTRQSSIPRQSRDSVVKAEEARRTESMNRPIWCKVDRVARYLNEQLAAELSRSTSGSARHSLTFGWGFLVPETASPDALQRIAGKLDILPAPRFRQSQDALPAPHAHSLTMIDATRQSLPLLPSPSSLDAFRSLPPPPGLPCPRPRRPATSSGPPAPLLPAGAGTRGWVPPPVATRLTSATIYGNPEK